MNEGQSWGPNVSEDLFAQVPHLPGDTCSCQLLLPCYSPVPGQDNFHGYLLNTNPDIWPLSIVGGMEVTLEIHLPSSILSSLHPQAVGCPRGH